MLIEPLAAFGWVVLKSSTPPPSVVPPGSTEVTDTSVATDSKPPLAR
jgi:hypothetical protein